MHEIISSSEPNPKIDEVKAVITLRNGKEVKQPVPQPAEEGHEAKEAEPEEEVIKENAVKKSTPPPFPQALNVDKKAFLTKQVSAIIQCKTPVKYKDPGCPTISVNIEGTCVENALLDLEASVNLLPYSMYKHLGLGELKPTPITLSLADRSIKIPKGTVEDVLVQVDKFYYPVDFVMLDTEPITVGTNYVPIILGRPFLATSNVIINFRNGVIQLTFGNMTLELNIFHLNKNHMQPVEEEPEEVCIIDTILDEQVDQQQMQDVLIEELSDCSEELQEAQDLNIVHGQWRKKKFYLC